MNEEDLAAYVLFLSQGKVVMRPANRDYFLPGASRPGAEPRHRSWTEHGRCAALRTAPCHPMITGKPLSAAPCRQKGHRQVFLCSAVSVCRPAVRRLFLPTAAWSRLGNAAATPPKLPSPPPPAPPRPPWSDMSFLLGFPCRTLRNGYASSSTIRGRACPRSSRLSIAASSIGCSAVFACLFHKPGIKWRAL